MVTTPDGFQIQKVGSTRNREWKAIKKNRVEIDEYSGLTLEKLQDFLDQIRMIGPDPELNFRIFADHDDVDDELYLYVEYSRPATQAEIQTAEVEAKERDRTKHQDEIKTLRTRLEELERRGKITS